MLTVTTLYPWDNPKRSEKVPGKGKGGGGKREGKMWRE